MLWARGVGHGFGGKHSCGVGTRKIAENVDSVTCFPLNELTSENLCRRTSGIHGGTPA
jgi:hypothetical protein